MVGRRPPWHAMPISIAQVAPWGVCFMFMARMALFSGWISISISCRWFVAIGACVLIKSYIREICCKRLHHERAWSRGVLNFHRMSTNWKKGTTGRVSTGDQPGLGSQLESVLSRSRLQKRIYRFIVVQVVLPGKLVFWMSVLFFVICF